MHKLPSYFLTRPVNVDVVGAGGTGSQMLSGLARLHRALLAVGHPGGLDVTVYDPDHVSAANVGRQLFYDADIGQSKADVLVHRLNQCFGTAWCAQNKRFALEHSHRIDLVIGCVDSAASRRTIHQLCTQRRVSYWLDLGNRAGDGQCVLGEPLQGRDWYMRLPTVMDLFPELLDESRIEDDAPSCSLAEALERQELFVNQAIATAALQLLWQLFRYGEIPYHGLFVNLARGSTTNLPVDRDAWRRFGFRGARKPPTRGAKPAKMA